LDNFDPQWRGMGNGTRNNQLVSRQNFRRGNRWKKKIKRQKSRIPLARGESGKTKKKEKEKIIKT